MASTTADDENSKRSPLTVNTMELPSNGLTPTASNEKDNTDPRRPSNATTPSTAHNTNPFDTDVEAMMTQSTENLKRKSTSGLRPNADCEVWPDQEHWKQKARAARAKNRNCRPLAQMHKRNRMIAKALIGLLVVGIAVAIGLGISKAVGAKPSNNS